jgi:AbiV family abortive infection protein
MGACVDNGERLLEDAEWLGYDRFVTACALCILAQEEFAKAFLLHLIGEGIVPWTAEIQRHLRQQTQQITGLRSVQAPARFAPFAPPHPNTRGIRA